MKKLFHLIPNLAVVLSIGISLLVYFLSANSVWAHAQMIKSDPPDKAELKESPKQADLWFNELLDEGFNTVEVFSATELSSKHPVNFAKGTPKVDPKDRTHLTAELSPLKPGKYVLRFRVLSRDGHTAPGQLTFEVRESKL